MYPNSELRQLALRKQLVRLRTTLHRAQCEEAGRHVAAAVDKGEYWFRTAKAWSGMAGLVAPLLGAKWFGRRSKAGPAGAKRKSRGKVGLVIDLVLLGWKLFRKYRSRPATYAGRDE